MSNIPKIDRQREHQANERTFLAWLRTSIALIGFGFAIARFGLFIRQLNFTLTQQPQEPSPHPFFTSENLGISLVIFGIITLFLAAWRYNQVFWQIEQGNYQPNRFAVWMMTSVVIIFGVLSIPLLLLRNKVPPSPSRNLSQPQARNFRYMGKKYFMR
ncbi:YidH family protein [Mastigocladopsis repens]|uniref:YidH family protein n=1 Tax=Mastigocladopsis repens TaxID=221287 RepID=UPI00031300DB|nr:DUF202 domain-containing protein [Mastigocladopsis repens]